MQRQGPGEEERSTPGPRLDHLHRGSSFIRLKATMCVLERHTENEIDCESTSLDPQQTTDQKTTEDTCEQDFNFRNCTIDRGRVVSYFKGTGSSHPNAARILACGRDAWIQRSPGTGRLRVSCTRCNHRMCPSCRLRWSRTVNARLQTELKAADRTKLKLLTLTIASNTTPLVQQIRRLWDAFNKLRGRPLWKQAVKGSATVLEITFNTARKMWHPHLHSILEAHFMPQGKLSLSWKRITKGSTMLDIRAIRRPDRTATYLTSYLTKAPVLPTDEEGTRINELMLAWCGARLVRYHGSFKHKLPPDEKENDYPTDWMPLMPLTECLRRADEGDGGCVQILRNLKGLGADEDQPGYDDS